MGHRIQRNTGMSASIVHQRKQGGEKGRKFKNRSAICTSSLAEKQKAYILHPAKAQKNVDFFFCVCVKVLVIKILRKVPSITAEAAENCWP